MDELGQRFASGRTLCDGVVLLLDAPDAVVLGGLLAQVERSHTNGNWSKWSEVGNMQRR